jgi:hypothetical protein
MNVFYKFRHTKDVIILEKTTNSGAVAFVRATILVTINNTITILTKIL